MSEPDERALFDKFCAGQGISDELLAGQAKAISWLTWQAARAESRQREEALRADAKRYRWLRAHSFIPKMEGVLTDRVIHFGHGYNQTKPELLDAAIDAASAPG